MEPNKLRVPKDQCIDLGGRCIEIIVGSECPTTLGVHETLICASSKFFKKAMSGDWKESRERSVRLQTVDPEILHIYLQWLYYKALPVRSDAGGVDSNNAEYLQLAQAYILGDMLQDTKFQNAIMNAMVNKSSSPALDGKRWYPGGPVIRVIYDNTLESSKARRLLVDMYTAHGNGKWLWEHATLDDLPKEFLFDVSVALLDKRTVPNWLTRIDPCNYCE